jgi:hypothetical protein
MTALEQKRTDGTGKKKRVGRPPGGSGKAGEPEKIRDYPKLNVTIKPATKALLKAASMVEGRSDWLIVDDAITKYIEQMPEQDRRAIEGLAKRVAEKAGQASE